MGRNGGAATAVTKQSSYDEVNENPSTGTAFKPPFNGIRLSAVNGNLDYKDGNGDSQTISKKFLAVDEIIPITITEIEGTTGQNTADMLLFRE